MAAGLFFDSVIAQTTHFANLVMDWGQLLIPQSDVDTLEPMIDMQPPLDQPAHCIGQFVKNDRISPVYCLSSQLDWLTAPPEQYRIAVLLKNGERVFGVLCRQIELVDAKQLSFQRIPACMAQRETPLIGLAVFNEDVRYLSSAQVLADFLSA